MKKVLSVLAVVTLLFATSCKKDYACENIGGVTGVNQDYPALDKAGADSGKANCDLLQGTWVTK